MKLAPSITLLRALSHLSPPPCHAHALRTTRRLLATDTKPTEPAKGKPKPEETLRTPELKHSRRRDGELQPKPLSKPLGLPFPPRAGENAANEHTAFKDYASYEKHIARRKEILKDIFERNYYRDIGNLGKIHRGKSILAPATPFRASVAMYFPNLSGVTLANSWTAQDTTPVVRDRISIVSVCNTEWANAQAQTFVSQKANPKVHEVINSALAQAAGAQFVTINVEPNTVKRWLVRLFFWNLRRIFPKDQHDKYFLLSKAIPEDIRDALGMWNSKVGYVYLLDSQARIRWAGNGDARPDEKESLANCLQRLCNEALGRVPPKVSREEPRSTFKTTATAAIA